MNEMELSPELVAREIALEAVACGIIEKSGSGYVWRGDKNDWTIVITAHRRTDSRNLTRIQEEDDRGYN